MELRYRVESRGWRIPQFKNVKTGEWEDITYGHLGKKTDPLHLIARKLAEATEISLSLRYDLQYHFTPEKKSEIDDESVIFKDDIYVAAFLGAVTVAYKTRTFDFSIGKVKESKKEKPTQVQQKADWYPFEGWTIMHRIPFTVNGKRNTKDVFSNTDDYHVIRDFLTEELELTSGEYAFYEGTTFSREVYDQQLKEVK